jgi:hypothetical protein
MFRVGLLSCSCSFVAVAVIAFGGGIYVGDEGRLAEQHALLADLLVADLDL